MVGTKVDSYELVKELGRGAMGVVFLARHDTTGRDVALKLLHPDRAGATGPAAQAALDRFRREARVMGTVAASENVVSILDAGLDSQTGSPFLVMELLEGEDLEELSTRLGPLPVELALRLVAQALAGLSPAHDAGIVHRDLKPSNLYLQKRPEGGRVVKVLDFGIAKLREGTQEPNAAKLTAEGTAVGSPAYMSPEQAQASKALDVRSDVWSMGVLLYQLLSGKVPFAEAETLRDLLIAIVLSHPLPVSRRAPWVPAAVEAIVDKATQHDPAARFANAREMRGAIVRQLGGTGVAAADAALLVITDAMIEPLPAEVRSSQLPVSGMAISVPGSLPGSVTRPVSAAGFAGGATAAAGGMGMSGPAVAGATMPLSAVPSGVLVAGGAPAAGAGAPPHAGPPAGAPPFAFPTQPSAGVAPPIKRAGPPVGWMIAGALLLVGAVGATAVLMRSPEADPAPASTMSTTPLPGADAGGVTTADAGALPPEPTATSTAASTSEPMQTAPISPSQGKVVRPSSASTLPPKTTNPTPGTQPGPKVKTID